MKKEFHYTIDKPEDITPKLADLDKQMREEFKVPAFKLNRTTFMNAAKCFENPSFPMESVEECTMRAFGPLSNYERSVQGAWKGELGTLRACIEKCGPGDKTCLSTCFNSFASKMHATMDDIHKTLQ